MLSRYCCCTHFTTNPDDDWSSIWKLGYFNEDLQPVAFIYNFKTPRPTTESTIPYLWSIIRKNNNNNLKSHQIFNETYIHVYIYIAIYEYIYIYRIYISFKYLFVTKWKRKWGEMKKKKRNAYVMENLSLHSYNQSILSYIFVSLHS